MKHSPSLAGMLRRAIGPFGMLLAAGVAVAAPPPPPAPSFAGHHDMRSREPAAAALSYRWTCGTTERAITLRPIYRQTTDSKGDPDVAASWAIGSYERAGTSMEPGDARLSAFVASLDAIAFIAGRCFDTEGEVRISGLVAGSPDPQTQVFRVP